MNRRQQGKMGFTLMELLIVIGIIAILAALVIVSIKPAQNLRQANNAVRWSEINSIVGAIKQYQADHEGANPPGLDTTLRMIGTASSGCSLDCGSSSDISYITSPATLNYYSNNTYTIRQQFNTSGFSSLTVSVVLDCDGSCNGDINITVGGQACAAIPASSVRTDGTTSDYTWYTTTCNVSSETISNPFYAQLLKYTGSGTIRFLMEENDPTGNPQFSTTGGWNNDNGDYFLKIGLPAKTAEACLNLSSALVDDYFNQLPVDPLSTVGQEKTYYAIREKAGGSLEAVACGAENNEEIKILR